MNNIEIWCGVNYDGRLSIHLSEPHRDTKHKIWMSDKPYANSFIYKQTQDIINMANITWQDEPEFFSIMLGEKNIKQ